MKFPAHRAGFPGTQWRTEREQRKFRSYCAPRPHLSRYGGTGHIAAISNPPIYIFNRLSQFFAAEISFSYPLLLITIIELHIKS
jgi:hypothetical protein